MKLKLFAISIFFSNFFFSQKSETDSISRKSISAIKIDKAPKIDGILDDEVWQNVPVAENFIERSPKNGAHEPDTHKTKVKVTFDDTGIYFGVKMFDPNPENIKKELQERDNIGNDDAFGVTINGYNDKQQAMLFIIQASGVQADAKIMTNADDDFSWNAVWYSATKINEDGWTAEIKIPYSELRFPKKDIQTWGINFIRVIQKTNQNITWNFVDNKKSNYLMYDGVMNGIQKIKTPTRLSFTPYFSTYINNYDGKTTSSINGGMDVKYGINDAFTFDMTLIPDFGQTNFDASILNLTPFEQQFAEQRPFFTEGTELFSKGDLFYSRRIGNAPSRSAQLHENEMILEEPAKVKLFNAFKISGRTNKGLGIGFFNGITEKAEATIVNLITGEKRTEQLEPWANYNVLVLDQRFHENSSVTLVNTNATRTGDFRDANATGFLWDINNKKNTFNFTGSMKGSWVMDNGTKFGTKGNIGVGKFSGKNRFSFMGTYADRKWDINDLGFSTTTNFANYNAWYGYRILQPTKKFNNIFANFNLNFTQRLVPFLYSNFNFNNNTQFTNTKFQTYGFGVETTPFGENDIYEPRTEGRYLKVPGYFDIWTWFESDSRKKFQFNASIDYYAYDQKGRNRVNPFLFLRYRFSDKFNMFWKISPSFSNNEIGYAGRAENNENLIYMGRRQRNTYENSITSQYTFNNKMTLSLAFRHYFSDVTYKNFYTLNQDGSLTDTHDFSNNLNGTYNSWNVDLRYSWWFAPGSQLTLLYRNAVSNYLEVSRMNVKNNFDTLFNEPMTNNISLRVTYFLDYNRIKHWF